MNCIHYLSDEIGLTKLKSKEITLRLLDKEKISNNRRLIQLINIILPIIILLLSNFIFLRSKNEKYG